MKFKRLQADLSNDELVQKIFAKIYDLKDEADRIRQKAEYNESNELASMMTGRWDALNELQKYIMNLGFDLKR